MSYAKTIVKPSCAIEDLNFECAHLKLDQIPRYDWMDVLAYRPEGSRFLLPGLVPEVSIISPDAGIYEPSVEML